MDKSVDLRYYDIPINWQTIQNKSIVEITRKYNFYPSAEWEEEQANKIQVLFDSFVAIRSKQLADLITVESLHNKKSPDTDWLKEYVLGILVKNDNLYTVADYVRKGSTEYYWYSDFLDNLDREGKKKYYFFDTSPITVTKSGYDKILASVDLPYFPEVVELVSALNAIKMLEPKERPEPESAKEEPETKPTFKSTLNPVQLEKLTEIINEVKLFKNCIATKELAELLSGDRKKKLQTTSTKLLYYLFEKLSEGKYIALDWWDIFLRNAILISSRGNVVENQDLRGAKQRVFAEYEGTLPKKHRIIDNFLDEIAELSDNSKI